MQDVSDKLLGQFIGCIEGKIGDAQPSAQPQEEEPIPAATAAAAAGSATESAAAAGETPPSVEETAQPAAAPVRPTIPDPATPPRQAPATDKDDALNLGSTVLPVLLKSYGRQAVIGVVVVVAVVVIWRALSG
jgi:hypothetical protein